MTDTSIREENLAEIVQVTSNDYHHFFGYFDKCPWNLSGKYLLTHRIDFCNRPLTADDYAIIGIVELGTHKFEPITKTYAWSWQQGAMLQWHPKYPEDRIIFNDRRDGRFVSVVYDINKGEEKVLPLPVAAVSNNGEKALSLNFARLADTRPGYGYEGIGDPYKNELAPDEDGIYLMDMESGKFELIVSLAQAKGLKSKANMEGVKHWFNHLLFSPNDKRFIFLHRWRNVDGKIRYRHYTRMLTANVDGTDIYLLNDDDMTSHFDWKNDSEVIAWANKYDVGERYFLFQDKTQDFEIVGDKVLTPFGDGHCTYSPDEKLILTDTYPDEESYRKLMVYNPQTDELKMLGKFYSQPWIGEARCDLHPRWSRDGKQICFDSSHTGKREIYIVTQL